MSEIDWNGEGLPPVGVVCEFAHGMGGDFARCLIVGHHPLNGRPIVDHRKIGASLSLAPECWVFRPLKTPEQKQREELAEILERTDGMNYMARADAILAEYTLTKK